MDRDDHLVPTSRSDVAITRTREDTLGNFTGRLRQLGEGGISQELVDLASRIETFAQLRGLRRDGEYGLLMFPEQPLYCTRIYDRTGFIMSCGAGGHYKADVSKMLVTYGGFHTAAHDSPMWFIRYVTEYFRMPVEAWDQLLADGVANYTVRSIENTPDDGRRYDPNTPPDVTQAEVDRAARVFEVMAMGDVFMTDRREGDLIIGQAFVLPRVVRIVQASKTMLGIALEFHYRHCSHSRRRSPFKRSLSSTARMTCGHQRFGSRVFRCRRNGWCGGDRRE